MCTHWGHIFPTFFQVALDICGAAEIRVKLKILHVKKKKKEVLMHLPILSTELFNNIQAETRFIVSLMKMRL